MTVSVRLRLSEPYQHRAERSSRELKRNSVLGLLHRDGWISVLMARLSVHAGNHICIAGRWYRRTRPGGGVKVHFATIGGNSKR